MVLVEAQLSLKDQEEPYKRLQEEPYVSSNSPPPPPPRPASGPPLAESAKTLSLWKGDGFSEHLVQLTRFNCAFLLSSGDLALLSPLPAASVQGGLPTWAAWPLRSWPSQRMLPPRPGQACDPDSAKPSRSWSLVPWGLFRDRLVQAPPGSSGSGIEARGGAAAEGRWKRLWKEIGQGRGRGERSAPASSARLQASFRENQCPLLSHRVKVSEPPAYPFPP